MREAELLLEAQARAVEEQRQLQVDDIPLHSYAIGNNPLRPRYTTTDPLTHPVSLARAQCHVSLPFGSAFIAQQVHFDANR